MRKLLIPLLAAFALPTAVNAESHWLILKFGLNNSGRSLEKIEMKSIAQCEEVGKKLVKRWEISSNRSNQYYACITGK